MLESIAASLIGALFKYYLEQSMVTQHTFTSCKSYENRHLSIHVETFLDNHKTDNEIIIIGKKKLSTKIQNEIEQVANEQIRNLNKKEQRFIDKIITDKDIEKLVRQKSFYKKEPKRLITAICYEDFEKYENKRIIEIKKGLLEFRSDEMFDELENEQKKER